MSERGRRERNTGAPAVLSGTLGLSAFSGNDFREMIWPCQANQSRSIVSGSSLRSSDRRGK